MRETVSVLKHTLQPAEKCSLIVPSSILSLNWNLAPISLYAALCPFNGEGSCVSYCLLYWVLSFGFFIHSLFSFLIWEKKVFLSVLLNVLFPFCCRCICKNCGMPGTKLTDQNQLSGDNVRKNKVFISSCHSQGMESECLFPGPGRVPYPAERASHL